MARLLGLALRQEDARGPDDPTVPDLARLAYLRGLEAEPMCRNIKTLFNFDPPATDEEIRAASLQYVRKLSGFNAPSKANQAAFEAAIDEVFEAGKRLLTSLETHAPPRDREVEAARAKARASERFARA